MSNMKKALAIGGAVVLAGAAFGAGAYLVPRTIEVPKEVIKEVKVAGPIQTIEVPVEKIVEKNVTVEVLVDNGNLALLEKELIEKNGNVEYLTDGLDDNEIELIVDRLQLANEWEHAAFLKAKDKIPDELHKEVVSGVTLYREDIRSLNIDPDTVTLENIDWTSKDVDVVLPFTFRMDDLKYEGVARVIVIDGKIDDFEVSDIARRT
jgi:hypothetical protein